MGWRTSGVLPSVAVIIPNHHRIEETLAAIASVRDQDYQGVTRISLVYQRRSEVQRLLDEAGSVSAIAYDDPGGINPIAAKRNLALRSSHEDLVAFLDDDDVWHPSKLRAQVDALREDRAAVGCSTDYVAFSTPPAWCPLAPKGVRAVSMLGVLRTAVITTSSVLVDGAVARALRFVERPDWFAVEDYDLWIRLRAHGRWLHVPQQLTGLRVDAATTSRQSRPRQLAKSLDVLAARTAEHGRDLALMSAALERCLTVALAGRLPRDPQAENILNRALDGRLFGRLDSVVSHVIKRVWRSKVALPAIHRARDRWRARSTSTRKSFSTRLPRHRR